MDKVEELKAALEDMVFQFGYRGVRDNRPMIWTGGLSALEEVFITLGWNDPHYLPDECCCEVEGCYEPDTSGLHWEGLYLRLCNKHTKQSLDNKPSPKIKQHAVSREATRDPITGRLR
jgi:hypothetical protein